MTIEAAWVPQIAKVVLVLPGYQPFLLTIDEAQTLGAATRLALIQAQPTKRKAPTND